MSIPSKDSAIDQSSNCMSAIEQTRLQISRNTEANKKSRLGQFLTPVRTAKFMAGLFTSTSSRKCHLLDAGAGIGSLSCAFLERCLTGNLIYDDVRLAAFEFDESIHVELQRSLALYTSKIPLSFEIIGGDFIDAAVHRILSGHDMFTHAILNPPYKKINSRSDHRLLLRKVGIETVNLYSAFVSLALLLLAPGGQIVAIIPRSFCNGPYYRPFRDFILGRAAIRHMHLFASRSKAFKDDAVLQENVIVRLERDGVQGPVAVSTSTDDTFTDLLVHEHSFDRIVFADDPEHFIHVPTTLEKNVIELSPAIRYTLADLGIQVSTGPVVEFRLKEHLRIRPEPGAMPLLYPVHFNRGGTSWPLASLKKPNAIIRNAETEKWFYPSGFYCVVRRFSSKEEKRRITASVVDPCAFPDIPLLGFENHLNLFHENKHGLPPALAFGLAVFLNSAAVDENFRRFNGHTQVNATDLRLMKYPSRTALIGLGEWAMQQGELTPFMIDAKIGALTE